MKERDERILFGIVPCTVLKISRDAVASTGARRTVAVKECEAESRRRAWER